MRTFLLRSMIGLGFLVSSASAMAAFSVDDLHSAAQIAVDEFEKSNSGHAPHITGYKVWKSGEDAKIKIYVSHDGMDMDFNYLCMKHGTSIACHAQ